MADIKAKKTVTETAKANGLSRSAVYRILDGEKMAAAAREQPSKSLRTERAGTEKWTAAEREQPIKSCRAYEAETEKRTTKAREHPSMRFSAERADTVKWTAAA